MARLWFESNKELLMLKRIVTRARHVYLVEGSLQRLHEIRSDWFGRTVRPVSPGIPTKVQ